MVWSEVHEINKNTPCDLCNSTKNVERKHIKKVIYGLTGPVDDGYRQSSICADCKSKG